MIVSWPDESNNDVVRPEAEWQEVTRSVNCVAIKHPIQIQKSQKCAFMVDEKQPVLWINGLVASESVPVEGDNKDQSVEAVETQELVYQGLQLPQEHLIMWIMCTVDIDSVNNTLLYPIE